MRKVIIWVFIILFAITLQTTMIPYLSIAGVYPDLVVASMMVIALWYGRLAAIWGGFFTGLLLDSWAPNQLGLQSMALISASVFVGLFDHKRINSGPIAQFFLFLLGSVVHDLVIFMAVGNYGTSLITFILGQVIPRALFTAMFGMAIVFMGHQVHPYGRR